MCLLLTDGSVQRCLLAELARELNEDLPLVCVLGVLEAADACPEGLRLAVLETL